MRIDDMRVYLVGSPRRFMQTLVKKESKCCSFAPVKILFANPVRNLYFFYEEKLFTPDLLRRPVVLS